MTEREIVLRERAAFLNGVWQAHIDRLVCQEKCETVGLYKWSSECKKALLDTADGAAAASHYPLPKITRPRVVQFNDKAWPHREWRYVGGSLQSRTIGADPDGQAYAWTANAQITPQRGIIEALADLIANPNETVEG